MSTKSKTTLAEFAKNSPVIRRNYKKSNLVDYKDEIRTMRCRGFSYLGVTKALTEHGVKTSYQNVLNFCKKNFKS